MEDVGNGFRQMAAQYGALSSLQLTFRTMAASQLADIAANCPSLSVLRLIGYEIVDSQNLVWVCQAWNRAYSELSHNALQAMEVN